jgi:hypothetical protein
MHDVQGTVTQPLWRFCGFLRRAGAKAGRGERLGRQTVWKMAGTALAADSAAG